MIPLLMLATSSAMTSPSVVEAERAYAAMAQEIGQWTAFRATAARGAIMFVPDPVDAIEWMQGKQDPPVAVRWAPAAAFLSCDARTGATIGPWRRPASVGYFTTIWSRQGRTWRWKVDFGDSLPVAMPRDPTKVPVRRASCAPVRPSKIPPSAIAERAGTGGSADRSLQWRWWVERDGSRHFKVFLWNGRSFAPVIDRTIAAGG